MTDDAPISGPDASPRAARKRKAIGPQRQTYFRADDVDRVMAILLALVSEVATIRERLDTHERLGAQDLFATEDRVESYRPGDAVEGVREAWRDAFIRRLFRVITEDVEALGETVGQEEDPPG